MRRMRKRLAGIELGRTFERVRQRCETRGKFVELVPHVRQQEMI